MHTRTPLLVTLAVALTLSPASAQPTNQAAQDPALNNLVHPEGYKSCELGALGGVVAYGSGPTTLVLMPGWGFDDKIFRPIIDEDSETFTYLVVTPAGNAETPAPPMPDAGTSYEQRTWWAAYERAVWSEIERREITNPVLVPYLDTAQSAVLIARAHPGKVAGIVALAGLPVMQFQQPIPKAVRGTLVDQQVALSWFKTVTQATWNQGMGAADWYASDEAVGEPLYRQSLVTPIPNLVRLYCEHWATDITEEVSGLDTPVFALLPDSGDGASNPMYADFVQRALRGPWNTIGEDNDNVRTRTLDGARMGMLYTHTDEINQALLKFCAEL